MMGDEIRHPKKRAFLAAMGECGNVSQACELAGIHRSTHYDWLENDPEYAEAFAHAEDHAAERLEQEARRRAVEGVEKPVYQGGRQVGVVREYSDTLLIFLLKGAKPEKYQERSRTEIAGANGEPLTIRFVDECTK